MANLDTMLHDLRRLETELEECGRLGLNRTSRINEYAMISARINSLKFHIQDYGTQAKMVKVEAIVEGAKYEAYYTNISDIDAIILTTFKFKGQEVSDIKTSTVELGIFRISQTLKSQN